MDMTGHRLGCPFPKCYPVEYQDVVNPCTNRPGFDGFRLLNEHIWKYHSFKYHCHICLKRFTTAGHEKVAKIVEAHMLKEHSSSRRSSTSTSSSSSRTLKSSSSRSSPKRKRHSPNSSSSDESCTEDGVYYGGAFYNMTLEQDKAFLEWQEKERKVKNLDTAKKYQDLVKALFGASAVQPDSPYFDYLVPKHLVTDYVMDDFNRRLAAMGFESLEELEAEYASQQNKSSLNHTFATTRMAAARGMPEPSYALEIPIEAENEHLNAMYHYQNPYAALYPMGGAVDEAAADGGEADGGEFTGLPGTHAPHHHHHASHPYPTHNPPPRRPASAKPSHHKTSTTSWSISNTGPDSGYASVEIDSECPQTSGVAPVGGMLDISGMGGCFTHMGADGLMHSGLRPEMRNATFNQSTILGLDRIDEDYQMAAGWHPVILEEF